MKFLELPIKIGAWLSNSREELDEDIQNASGYNNLKWFELGTSPTSRSIIVLPPSHSSSLPPPNATPSVMMMEVYKEVVESGEMQYVLEKAFKIATRMEVCKNVPDTWQMVGKSMEVEGVIHGLFHFLNCFNSLIKKVQVK